jgi:hypothetical protein
MFFQYFYMNKPHQVDPDLNCMQNFSSSESVSVAYINFKGVTVAAHDKRNIFSSQKHVFHTQKTSILLHTIFYIFSSSAEDMKIVTKNESSVTDDIPHSISSSRNEILLISEKFHLL